MRERRLQKSTNSGIKTETIKSGAAVSFTGSSSSSSASKVKVETVKISGISNTLLAVKKMTLKAVVSPSNASDQRVTWSVSNNNYASVSSQGVVTAELAGAGKTVTITAKAKDGSGKSASVKMIKRMMQRLGKLIAGI